MVKQQLAQRIDPELAVGIRLGGYFRYRDHLYYCMEKKYSADRNCVEILAENVQTLCTTWLDYDKKMEVIHARNSTRVSTTRK